jgi:hypothetical protein
MKPDEKETKTEAAADAPARRPYHAPQLRRLGSVRDLTLGTGTMMPDSAGQLSGKFM